MRFAAHARTLVAALVVVGAALRVLLVAYSPAPFGYVWDFYHVGVQILYNQGRLPLAEDCWQCAHPPLFYLLGWPFYAVGRWIGGGSGDAVGLRWLGGLSLLSAAVTGYYGYKLLRWCRCRGALLVAGVAILAAIPCLFISSYAPEADIVLTAILSAFLYELVRHAARRSADRPGAAVRLGVLAGLAAATKYSGLVGLFTALIVIGLRAMTGPARARALRDGAIVLLIASLVGGWKYVDNYRRYGELLHANGSAAQGFSAVASRVHTGYEFTTLRLGDVRALVGPRPPEGELRSFPVTRSVLTMLHGLAWSDLSLFSVPSRHGDPSHPYPRKLIPVNLTMSVIVLGFVPEILAGVGVVVTLRRRAFRPIAIFCVVSIAAYVWWFLPQEAWALKTKYILFLLPPLVLYAMVGLSWLVRKIPAATVVAGALLATLTTLAFVYDFAFAVGRL